MELHSMFMKYQVQYSEDGNLFKLTYAFYTILVNFPKSYFEETES